MSRVETTAQTAKRFFATWNPLSERLADELLSLSQETNRRKDCYHFGFSERRLLDPTTGRLVSNFMEKETYLGRVEHEILNSLEKWTDNNDEGMAFWISPSFEGKYPCSKVIIHQIAYTLEGQKVLLNTVILFDADLKNPETLRSTLFTREDSKEAFEDITGWIERVSGQRINLEDTDESTNQARYFSRKISRGYPHDEIIQEMLATRFLGNHSISCPPSSTSSGTFLEIVSSHAHLISSEGKFVKNCGNCGTEINSVISKGYRCKRCGGIYEGC